METEPKTEQPVTTAALPTEPVVESAPQTSPEPVPETKYGGKSLEQMAAEMEQKDSYITQLAQKAALAEHEAQLAKNLFDQIQQGSKKTEPEVPGFDAEAMLDAYAKDPINTTMRLVKMQIQAEQREREQADLSTKANKAKENFEAGYAEAYKKNPRIFNGIEDSVKQETFNGVKIWFDTRGKYGVDPEALSNPEYWIKAAGAQRFVSKGETNLASYFNAVPTPVQAVHTETPTASNPPQSAISLSQEEKEYARQWGISETDFMETKKRSEAEKQRMSR